MISKTVEYALRAAVYLADEQGAAKTTRQIAKATQVAAPYLSKVLQNLVKAGLIVSQRGLHGGFSLARAPAAMTIWDVVDAVDPLQRIRTCPLDLASHRTRLCALHTRLDEALAMVENAFRQTTLAELLADSNPSRPLCDVAEKIQAARRRTKT